MEFTIDRDVFLKSLGHAYGIIEKKTTLQILSNILIEAKNSKIRITATDLDIIYSEEIPLLELKKEGSTTTSANVLYDILRKIESDDDEDGIQNIVTGTIRKMSEIHSTMTLTRSECEELFQPADKLVNAMLGKIRLKHMS